MARRPQLCPDKMARMLTLASEVTGQTRPDSASVLRKESTRDAAGGFVDTWVAVQTHISARVKAQGMQPWEKIDRIGSRPVSTSVFKISLPAGTDVRPTDRLRIDSFVPSITYEVIGSDGPASFEVERTVQAIRLQ